MPHERTADADAEAISARGNALAGENQELIAANKLVDMLPTLSKPPRGRSRDLG